MDNYQLASSYVRYTSRCVFLTGKAGTGKTTFLRNLHDESLKQMAVVAPTGVAAINAGGATIHSFFQIPPQLFLPTQEARRALFQEMQMRKQKIQVLRNLELLVIDEISMVRADLLDAIDAILRHYRHRNTPFGGVQMLFIGDLFQLSPVARQQEWDILREYYQGPYFFQARVFQEIAPVYIELDHIFRQDNQQFIDILNQVRNNQLSATSRNLLNTRYQPDYVQTEDDFHIILSTHNQKVDQINERGLAKLPSEARTYQASIEGTFPESMFPNDAELTLKVGARVMFVKNDSSPEKRYYNGKLGIVTALDEDCITVACEDQTIEVTPEEWQNLRYEAGNTVETVNAVRVGSFTQMPLRLAWAITIHKSQGLTFDNVVIDAADAFAAGQVYVALSRCRTLEGIILLSRIPEHALSNAQEVLHYVEAQPEQPAVEKALPTAQTDYLTQILTSIFDFRDHIRRVDQLRAISSKEAAYSAPTADFLLQIKGGLEGLQVIAETFQNQLRQIIYAESQGQALPQDKSLPARVKAASDYFAPKVGELIDKLRHSPCTTENKESRTEFEEAINVLYTDLSRLLYLMQRMAKEPSIRNYQKERQHFTIPKVYISANPEQTTEEDIPNPALFRMLMARRKQIATEADIEPWSIATKTHIIEICKRLPLRKTELMKIPKFGKKKYEVWGEDILQIVARYIRSNPELFAIHAQLPKRLRGDYL